MTSPSLDVEDNTRKAYSARIFENMNEHMNQEWTEKDREVWRQILSSEVTLKALAKTVASALDASVFQQFVTIDYSKDDALIHATSIQASITQAAEIMEKLILLALPQEDE